MVPIIAEGPASVRCLPRVDGSPVEAMALRLVAEYGAVLGGAVVRDQIYRCREQLIAAGVRAGLVIATEAAARHRLSAATQVGRHTS